MVYFLVEDVSATVAKATELGDAVSVPPTERGAGAFCVLAEPQGAVFTVMNMTVVDPPPGY